MKVKPEDEQVALKAGKVLFKHRHVPFADSLVAALVYCKMSEYILRDGQDFRRLDARLNSSILSDIFGSFKLHYRGSG